MIIRNTDFLYPNSACIPLYTDLTKRARASKLSTKLPNKEDRMTSKNLIRAATLLALAFLLAACDTSTIATPTVGTVINDTPTMEALPGGALVRMRTSGGIAGLDAVLTVDETGQTSLVQRDKPAGASTLTEAQLNDLKAQLNAVRALDLQEKYDRGGVADDIYNTIQFSKDGNIKSVTVAEVGGKRITPPALQALISTLTQIANAR